MPELDPDILLRICFDPIARDGARIVEVQLRLQKVLSRLAACPDPDFAAAARAASARALAHAQAGLPRPRIWPAPAPRRSDRGYSAASA